jgi:DNA adenine methylase
MKLTPPLKTHGGKHDLAKWIISLMPPRCRNPNKPDPKDKGWLAYCEPYFGGGAVLLANDPVGISEVVNDKNLELTNFWCVLQSREHFREFSRRINATPFSEQEFLWTEERTPDFAVGFFIRCRQSLAGRMQGFAPLTRNRTRRGMNEQASAWWNCVAGLPAVHERLKRVVILNDEALNVIKSQDGPRTLYYLDPPYLHSTRASNGEYDHEMTTTDHRDLLFVLAQIKGRFLLSGYHSKLYDTFAKTQGWACHEKKINNHAASGKKKRVMTECVFTNF